MKRSGFSMIELVFVIVILGVLAAVAVPRFVATRTDAQIATARSDMASAMKAIVAKIFADNIDPTYQSAPPPNEKASSNWTGITWGQWIVEVSGLDGARWAVGGALMSDAGRGTGQSFVGFPKADDQVQPLGNVNDVAAGVKGKGGCGGLLGIVTGQNKGYMVFLPGALNTGRGAFCKGLSDSYKNSLGTGNRVVPLGASDTLTF